MKLKPPTFEQATAIIDEYLRDLSNPDKTYGQVCSRTHLEAQLVHWGVIPSTRGLMLGDSHALWYACLIITGRVMEVSKAEKAKREKMGYDSLYQRTTYKTVRDILSGKNRSIVAPLVRRLVENAL